MRYILSFLNLLILIGLSGSFLFVFIYHFPDVLNFVLPKGVEQSNAKELTRATFLVILAVPLVLMGPILIGAFLLWLADGAGDWGGSDGDMDLDL